MTHHDQRSGLLRAGMFTSRTGPDEIAIRCEWLIPAKISAGEKAFGFALC